jgi:large repetitive protein
MKYLRMESVYRRPVILLVAMFSMLLAGVSAQAGLVQDFYLPMPEAQISQVNGTIISGSAGAINSTFSIVVTGGGTVIYYDQWEDGYETDLGNPTQSTTQIWGDGNDAHGIPPGFAHNPLGLPAGTVITLTNSVPLPRNPSQILYDARDHIAANKAVVISRAGWPTAVGPVFAGAVGVLSTMDYGTNYISPVGQDLTPNLFKYVGMFIMAAQNNTAITIDPNGNGVGTTNIVLNQGESYLVNGGIKKGGRVTATKAIQADLVIGHTGASYASDWFTLYPVSAWDNSYYTPVGSAASGSQPAYVYLFNPFTNAITVNYKTLSASGSFSIPGTNGVYQFQMPIGSGASFISAGGQNFFAVCTVAANNTADTSYNWGFTLVPKAALTTKAVVGWGPGSADGTVNGSPVWVTALANTTLYVDYKGDTNGPLTDPSGLRYDTNFTVSALQTMKIYDPSKNQTAMKVYTVDGTLLTAAWGEDPDVAAPGNPYIDAGTTVIPFPTPVLFKSVTNLSSTSGLHIGDTLQYNVEVDNRGLLPLGNTVVIDTPTTNLTYVTNSTTLNGVAIADNAFPYSATNTAFPLDSLGSAGYTIPVILSQGTSLFTYQVKVNAAGSVSNSVNIGGTTIIAQTVVPPATSATVSLNFTDTNGLSVASYLAGAKIFVWMTNAVGNTSSNTVETISVTVTDTNTGDAETIPLVETGTNSGVFRNIAGLPSSAVSGLVAQDGTLYVAPGDTLSVSYTDPVYLDSASSTAAIQIPTPNKQLYLSANGVAGNQFLNRVNPGATVGHGTTYNSIDIGSGGGSGIALDNTTFSNTLANATSLTVLHTTGASANYMLVTVGIFTFNADDPVTGIYYTNTTAHTGQALTRLTSVLSSATSQGARTEIWGLANPSTGGTFVNITLTSSRGLNAGVTTFSGVSSSTPTGNVVSNSATTGATSSVSLATTAGQYVVSVAGAVGTPTPAPTLSANGAGQISLWTTNAVGGDSGTTTCTISNAVVGATTALSATWSASSPWAMCAVALNAAASGGSGGPATNTTSFAQTPALALPFTLPAGGAVSITNFIAITNGAANFTGNLNITATLRTNGVNFLTLTNPTYTGAAGVTNLVWTGTLATNYTLPATTVITYVVTNNIAGTAFHVNYDSTNSASQIVLPASTVIAFSGFAVYDAPYPGGSLVTTPVAGTTLYVRAAVTDPFGSYDITSLGLAFTAPNTNNNFSVTLNDTSAVFTNASTKIYEYVWNTGPALGNYTIAATANEGSEGVKANATAGITTIFLDLGTPSITQFTYGNNGAVTNAYLATSNVCVRVNDQNRNTNANTTEIISATISSSFGDVENLVLTETGTNTGIFTACIAATTNTAAPFGGGTLVAPVGSVLTVSYSDPTDPTDNTSATATVQPPPGVPGILMTKTIVSPSGGQVGVGKSVVYNLQVVNTGSTTLTNVSITDTFTSARLSFTSASVAPNLTTANSLTWTNLGIFATGASTNLTVTFTTLATGTATNSATAASTTATNVSGVTISVNNAAINVVKFLLSPTNTPVAVGSNVVFRITFQNTGNTVINYLPFEDNFSGAYFQYVSATIPANGSGFGSLIWTNIAPAGLATNAVITNDVTMKVVGQGNPANNTAVVDYATDIFGNAVPTATGSTNVVTAAASVNGYVYTDATTNHTGIYNTNDTGLSGVTLKLYTADTNGNPATLVQQTTSDANGYYELLNLNLGKYVLVGTLLTGNSGSAPPNNQFSLNITNLAAVTNINFFQYVTPPALNSTFSGTVFSDTNGFGTNTLQAGLANVTVSLVSDVNSNGVADAGEPVVNSVQTDGSGNYSFAGIAPGRYVLSESVPFGYYPSGDSQPPNNAQISFTTTNAVTSTTNNFFLRLLPTAVADVNSALYFVATNLYPLTNDISPNGDALTITSAVSSNGIVVINSGSTNLTFTPTNLGVTTITYTIADAHGGASTNTITVNVTALADLAVGKTGAASVFAVSNLTYTISVTNFGPSPASGIIVTDALPNTVSFVNASGNGANNAGSVTWNIASLASGAVSNLTVTVTSPASGTLTNTASVGSPTPEPTLTNNTTPPVITTVTPVADLGIGKTAAGSVLASNSLSYTISVTNFGPSTASGVVVTDTLPATVSFVSASGNGANNSGVVNWTIGTLTNGQVTNLTLTVTAPAIGTLTNTANVSSPTGDPNSTNNVTPQVVTTVTPVADLAVGKIGAASGIINTSFNYGILVTNLGPSAAASFSVTDSLPAGIVFVSSSPATTTNLANQVIWNVSSLAANAVTNFTLTVQAVSRATFTNIATAGGPTLDPAPTNNSSTPVVTSITNRPPVAVNDSAATARNVAVTIPVLANDSDPDGDTVTIFSVSPIGGTFSISGANIIYTPTNAVPATNIFSYTISDGFGGTSTASITVAVTNRPPVAANDSASTTENVSVTVPVLVNDSDSDGDALTIISTSPTNGAAIISGTNVVFTPATNFTGTATCGYGIRDNFGGTNFAVITITVTNLPPLANPDNYAITENTTNTFAPLTNDVLRTSGGTLQIIGVSPTNGTATIQNLTNIVFTPTLNFLGTATIGYTIIDGIGGTNSSLITITVTNIPPLANPDSYSAPENFSSTFSPMTNDVLRTPGGVLNILSVTPTNGAASFSGTNVIFTPSANFTGTAYIGYTITDGIGGTNSSVITVIVTNIPPLALPDNYAVTENSTNILNPLANDTLRTLGGTLSIIALNPTNGTATASGTNVIFTPTPNFVGVATIGYTITDGIGGTNSSLITITVTNVPPTATPDNYSITENTTNNFAVLVNDFVNTSGGSLTLLSVTTTNGSASVSGTNVVFRPATNYLGTLTLTYTIIDGIGGTNSSVVTVTVTNIPPLANPDGYTVLENSTNTFAPLTNDVVRTPGGTLQIIGVSPTNGTATILNGTNIIFTPSNNFTGTATVGYTITDGIGGTNSSVITVTVQPVADLAVSKSGPAVVYAATNFSYTITVTNLGPGAAANLSVTDNLPAAVSFVSSTAGATLVGSQLVWTNLGSLAANAATNLTVTVTAPVTGVSLTNLASAGSPTSDPNPTNNTSPPVVTSVTPVADLVIVKTGPASVLATGSVTYNISVTNFGPSSASAVVVTDTLPNTVSFVSASGNGVNNSGIVTWNLGTLANGSSSNLTVTVTAPASGTLTNIASVGSPTLDTNTLNNTTPPVVTTVGAVADLAIGKSAAASVFAASNLSYTISVTNFGPSTASSVTVTDAVPVGASFVNASGSFVNNSGVVVWSLGDLANGAIASVTLTVTAPASGSLTNVATVGSPTGDPATTNNVTPPVITSVIPLADLTVAKVGPALVFAASNLSYTISVTNSGPSSASSVIVTDSLPANVTFVSASGNGTNNSGVVTWNLGTLANGAASNLTVTVTAPASGTLTNTASVGSPTGDTNVLNNTTPPVITSVTPLADVSVVKSGPAGIIFGTNFNYTIAVSNAGPSTAASLSVTDSLPAGLSFVSAVPAATVNGNQVVWNLGDFAAGTGSNLTLTVISTARGSLTNIATGGSPTGDPNPTNNSAPPVVTSVTNNPPTANPDNYAVTENTTNTFSPLFNDLANTPGGALQIIGLNPTNGTAVILNLTNVVFTPSPNFTGTATVGYTITDGVGGTNSSVITVLVTNIPPTAQPDSFAITENTTNNFAVLVNDFVNTTGGSLTLLSVTTTNGTANVSGTNIVFTPAPNYLGALTLSYTIIDNIGGTNSTTVTVTVTNIPPLALPDNYVVPQNSTNTFAPLANDSVQTPGGGLQIIGVSPTNGTATIQNLTNVVFTPSSNFVGMATIGYTITDGIGGTNSSVITVTVTNLPPTANAQSLATTENVALPVTLTGSDPANFPLTFIIVGAPAGGTLTGLNTNTGAVTYTPTNNFTGTDSFTFRVNNGYSSSATATVTIAVTPTADLAVAQSGPAAGVAGASLVFTVAVTNLGPAGATNVVVTNRIDSGYTFVGASANGATNGNFVTWIIPVLPANGATNFTVTLFAVEGGTFTNIASGISATPDLNTANNDGSQTNAQVVTTVSASADVAVFKTGTTSVLAGGTVNYTIVATNFGPSTASNVVVSDTLPAGAALQTASGNYSVNSGVITWAAATLAGGAGTNFTVTLTAPFSGTLTNIASSTSDTADPDPGNNDGSSPGSVVVTPVTLVADLAIGKSAAASVLATSNLVYTISVTNLGPSTASSVTVTDAVPAGANFVNASGSYANNSGVVVWNLGDLASGAVSSVTLTVAAPASGSLTNIASVGSPTGDPAATNNVTPPVVTTVTPVADIAVGKSAPAGATFNTNFSYTISVTNFGPSAASGILVTDTLPAGVIFASAVPSATTNLLGEVIWSVGSLAANATTNFTLTVVSTARGAVTNFATAGSPVFDPVPTNNTSPLVVTLVTNIPPVANPDSYAIAENSGTNTFALLVNDTLRNPGGGLQIVSVSTTNGAATVSGTNVLFVPGTNYSGSLTINYTITDGVGGTNSSTIAVLVTNVPPTANPDSYAVTENSTNIFNPLANDLVNTPGGALQIAGVSPTNGTAAISGTNVVFVPSPNFLGTATIGYTITDGIGGTNSSVITVLVTNIPPTATPDNYSITENTTNSFSVLVNDFVNTTGGSLTLLSVTTTNGNATVSGTNVVFTPAANYLGALTLNYTIIDNIGGTNSSTVTVTVTNIPPLANPDSYAVAENSTNTFAPLVNDVVRTPGGSLQIIGVSPTNGTVTVQNLTNVVFTPASNFIGTATIGYTITDGIGGTNSSVITVTVTNIPPSANPDSYAIAENTTNSFAVLVNDFVNTSGGSLTLLSVTTTNGSASVIGTNIVFTPALNYRGTLTLNYTITDGIGGTNGSTVAVLVTNIPPVANPDSYTIGENSGTNSFSPLINDVVKTPGGVLQIISVSPTNGTAVISGTNVLFKPNTNFFGMATIGYTITDGIGGTNSSVITVTVTNVPPVANGQSVNTPENTPVQITLTGSDPNGLPLTFAIVGNPANGALSALNTNTGAVTYTPGTNYTGADSFTFRVNNGQTNSASATVNLTVTPVADLVVVQAGPTNGVAGSNLVFTVSVTNRGPAAATSLVVSNKLAAGFTFVSASSSGAVNGNLVTWNFASLPANGVTNFTVTAFATEGGIYTNIASGASALLDLNSTNNNGSLTNAWSRTTVSALADVQVFKDGGTNVYAGQAVSYTITATNAGPSTAQNVAVQDNLPPGATFQSASGSYSVVSNTVTWSGLTLAPGTATIFTLTMLASAASNSFVNIALATSSTPDPNPTNNNGSFSKSRLTTKVAPSADVVVVLNGPASAILGSNFVYTISVTNTGPSVSSNLVTSDSLPPGLKFVSASSGGTTNTSNVVTWPAVVSLPVGGVTNYTVTVRSATSGDYTNVVSEVSTTYDPNTTNNSGVLPASRVRTTVAAPQFLLLAGSPVLNPQTGLFEETVVVTNNGSVTVLGFRLNIGGLRSGVSLWNANGTNNGVPYINYNFPLDPSNHTSVVLEFYDPTRLPFTNTVSIEVITPQSVSYTGTNGSVAVSRVFLDTRLTNDTRFVIEFASTPGKTYAVIYNSVLTGTNWSVATPSVTANANVTQWYDDGPPKTSNKPETAGTRFYRVIQY